MIFLRVFLAATIAVVAAGLIPLHIVAALVCWTILVASGWWYAAASAKKAGAVPGLIGYGAGMGALVGAPVSIAATIVTMLYHRAGFDLWALALFGSSGLSGAFLGALGGAAGSLRTPRTAPSSTQLRNARFVWIGLAVVVLFMGGAVAYVIALAKAMSDLN